MNYLIVERYGFNPDWTTGELYVNGKPDGFTIEDEERDIKVQGETAIDCGIYELDIRQSPKFSSSFLWSDGLKKLIDTKSSTLTTDKAGAKDWQPHNLIWIKGTPRHTYCLIHWGNTDKHTDGCLIVGRSTGFIGDRGAVLDSRRYYAELYARIYPTIAAGGQYIEIRHRLAA